MTCSHRLSIELEVHHGTDDDAQEILDALVAMLAELQPLTNAEPTGGTIHPGGPSELEHRPWTDEAFS